MGASVAEPVGSQTPEKLDVRGEEKRDYQGPQPA
jgi:hypothetical protein